jgi:putative ABC transport system permease protein
MNNLPISLRVLVPLAASFALVLILYGLGKVPIGYNLRNLRVRWWTTLLTALAFTLVVALLTVMLAFVNGMNKLTEGSGQPGNVLILSDGATDELFSNLGYNSTENIERQVVDKDENGQPLPQPVGVLQVQRGDRPVYLCSREIYLVVNQPVPTIEGQPERRRFVQLRGVLDPEIAGLVHGLELEAGGRWPSESGVAGLEGDLTPGHAAAAAGTVGLGVAGPWSALAAVVAEKGRLPSAREAIEVVLGQGVAGVMGADRNRGPLTVGDTFEMGDRKWVIVGIMKSAGSTFDSELWAKQDLVGKMFRKESYTTIVARTRDAASARHMSSFLSRAFKESAVQAQPETVYYAKMTETNQQFLVAIIFVAIIMAIGGVFGVMNTMFAAISQRTKDIGVLRLLGFSRWQILVSFLLETLCIALAGGLVGCALGAMANGWSANSIVGSGMGGSPKSVALEMIVDANTVAAGLLFTLVMGALGGLLPALTAMRLRPLESLR